MDFDEEVEKMTTTAGAKKKRAPSKKSKPAPPPDAEEVEEVKEEDGVEEVKKPAKEKKTGKKRPAATQATPEDDEPPAEEEGNEEEDEDVEEGGKRKKKGGKAAKKEEVPLPPKLEAARPQGDKYVPKPKRSVTSIRTLFYQRFNKDPETGALYNKGDAEYDELDQIKKEVIKENNLPIRSKDLSHEDRELIHSELIKRCPNYKLAADEFDKINDTWKKECEKWKNANKEMYQWTEDCKNWRKANTSKINKNKHRENERQLKEAKEQIAALTGSGGSSAIVIHSGRSSDQVGNFKQYAHVFKKGAQINNLVNELIQDMVEAI